MPGDVAVVGYDNLGAATTTSPTLTTIVNPVVAMARTAGQMLIDLLTGKKVDQAPVIFAPELVVRLSASGLLLIDLLMGKRSAGLSESGQAPEHPEYWGRSRPAGSLWTFLCSHAAAGTRLLVGDDR